MREQQNEMPGFLFCFFISEAGAGNQKCFTTPLSAGYKFLFPMDNVQKICTPRARGKKNFLRVLEKRKDPLKYFVHGEP